MTEQQTLPTLSIRSPWWWWILYGSKTIENRSRATKHRGTILIHASSYWNQPEIQEDHDSAFGMALDAMKMGDSPSVPKRDIFSGLKPVNGSQIVGIADIVDSITESDSPWFVGPHGWVLANVVPLQNPYSFPGKLGLFKAPASDEVKRLLGMRAG